MSQFIVGLTGGIGSGKTVVSDYLKQLGIIIVDADIVAREVVAKGSMGLQQLSEVFGDAILLESGELNRAKLREIVFSDSEKRKLLEQITHPKIFQSMITQLNEATSPYVVLVSPLLLEGKQKELVHRVVLVDTPEEKQIQRASERDNQSVEQIKKIMSVQMSRQQKKQLADDIIDNIGSLTELYEKVDQLHQQYLIFAKNKKDELPQS